MGGRVNKTRDTIEVKKVQKSAKTNESRTIINQDERQCFYCRSTTHFLSNFVLFQQRKNRQKGNNSTKVPPG